jgi:predicted nucleotidyltransferase
MNTAAPARLRTDPVLAEAKRRLEALYGARVKRIVLFGSRARGDHKRNSDYDIAVFLRGEKSDEDRPLAELNYDFLTELDKDVMVLAFDLNAWRRKTALMLNIRQDGVEF